MGSLVTAISPINFRCVNLPGADDNCATTIGNNSCPSNLNTCYTISCLYFTSGSAAAIATQSFNSYMQLVDGGNTNNLLQQINSSNSAGALRNLLMAKSPYLSDAALITMLNKTIPLPPGHIEQIIVANSPLTKPVMSVVETKGLPNGIMNNILAAQTGISPRAEKENEVNYYAYQKKLADVRLEQAYLAVDNLDSLKIVAEKDTTLAGLFKQMEILLAKGDLANAQLCRTKIINKESPHVSDQCKFLSTALNLKLAGKTWFDMTASQANLINQIYLNNPEKAINARAVLALTKGFRYSRYPFDLNANHTMVYENLVLKPERTDQELKIYPNPAVDVITVETNGDNQGFSQLIVYNILGTEIERQSFGQSNLITIDAKNYNNGIYLFVLITESGIIEKHKIIVSK